MRSSLAPMEPVCHGNIPAGNCAIRGFSTSCIPNAVLVPHRHDFCEMFWFRTGSAIHFNAERRYETGAGFLVLVNAGQVHSWEFSPDIGGHVIFFPPELLGQGDHFRTSLAPFGFLSASSSSLVIEVPPAHRTGIDAICERMMAEQEVSLRYRNEILRTCLELILIEAGRHDPAGDEIGASPGARIARDFLTLLDVHFREVHDTQSYAHLLQTSAYTLGQNIQEHLGKSPACLIRERRLAEARRLLLDTTLTISEIAYDLGFRTPSNFGRFFRNYVGKTPGELRSPPLPAAK